MNENWIHESVDPGSRRWEEFYRNRFQHDKRVRTTHGVNCTGSCSWEVFVKDGIVTWEMQATDYPQLEEGLPPYEPRGCQRGASFSWYLYSPIRVKYPYARGVLVDLWRQAKAEALGDPVHAWALIQEDPDRRRRYQQARGKGGFRRIGWDEALEIATASVIHTVKTYGPDRVAGFSPIPAMSQISYAAGSRFLSLLGGVVMSFYDWYCDLPPASPEIWGEQTDVHEAADWYNARFIAVVGSNLNMTRTPDTHFIAEVRHAGAKLAVFSPDFSMVAKYADWWIPSNAGQDTAFWLAVDHVLLTECYRDRSVPYFDEYVKQYTDLPFLVEIDADGRPGRYLRANRLDGYTSIEHGDWKLTVWDDEDDAPRMPNGTIGYRWADAEPGHWNLEMSDRVAGAKITPRLSFIDTPDSVVAVEFDDFGGGAPVHRGVPVRYVETAEGRVAVTTVFDLTMARFGVARGLEGYDARSYDDEDVPYTPAWQERYTGVHRDTVIRFAREWARNGELSRGKNLVIIGAGANHWYHNNLIYRSAIVALMLTGSVGVNGGGLGHYVGQEKVVNQASWSSIAFGLDWGMAPRHQNTPSFHYVHSDQWRYERGYRDYDSLPEADVHDRHTIDHQARAVRSGWLPFFPQFRQNPIELVRRLRREGATTDEAVVGRIVEGLVSGDVEFAVDDPDAPENWPRTWFIWRGNAIGTSAKGHEFFMRHYLGTDSTAIAGEPHDHGVTEVTVRPDAPVGKMDLVVDLNFRMDTSALYSDIVLPAATWYEKDDLNTTDCHSFINPMQAAVAPAWESRSDWQIFSALARRFTDLAPRHLPGTVEDVVMVPLLHDTPDELAQPVDADWRAGEVEPVPGKTMPKFRIVTRDYAHLYDQMVALGRATRENGVAAHGLKIPVADFYDELARRQPGPEGALPGMPSLERDREVCEAILALDPASNGELAYRAFEAEEHKTGRMLRQLGDGQRDTRWDFSDIVAQPRRVLTTPTWSGLVAKGRAYSPFTFNVEHLVPWRTLTGRQHFYLDHQKYLEWGEHLPVYKPRPDHSMLSETEQTLVEGQAGRLFSYITPHGKWSIHSTYSDNHRMMTLSRGGYPIWMNDKDAADLGIQDNDWVELFNDNGVFVQRCVTSARIPRNTVFVYHATERTIGIPISPRRGKRAGMNNSLTRTRLKPVLMTGGYAQFTYFFNYWGPTGVNRDTFVYLRRVDRPEL
jgi:nitrate reductase / nitrite oxidoreductase, alpha subunit